MPGFLEFCLRLLSIVINRKPSQPQRRRRKRVMVLHF
jgi:hypothetical protein